MSNEQQARRDAMWDADTLVGIYKQRSGNWRASNAAQAGYLGELVALRLVTGSPGAVETAILAARLAFRAVPALRG